VQKKKFSGDSKPGCTGNKAFVWNYDCLGLSANNTVKNENKNKLQVFDTW
jgi:hypothetical protein